MRRMERQGKRAREPETASAAPPLKQAKLEPTSAPSQQIKQEPTAGPAAATAVVNSGGVGIKQESAVVRPEGAAAAPLQAGGPGDQKRYQQLQQHAAQHQQQQQQPAKPLRQVWLQCPVSTFFLTVLSAALSAPHQNVCLSITWPIQCFLVYMPSMCIEHRQATNTSKHPAPRCPCLHGIAQMCHCTPICAQLYRMLRSHLWQRPTSVWLPGLAWK